MGDIPEDWDPLSRTEKARLWCHTQEAPKTPHSAMAGEAEREQSTSPAWRRPPSVQGVGTSPAGELGVETGGAGPSGEWGENEEGSGTGLSGVRDGNDVGTSGGCPNSVMKVTVGGTADGICPSVEQDMSGAGTGADTVRMVRSVTGSGAWPSEPDLS